MRLNALRWLLLPVAAGALLLIIMRGATPARLGVFCSCGLGWYALSRRKVYSLDRDRPR